ncbi:cytochrome c peroxidase [Persicitalea sp.]|uniref:cytochrome c peroxidase n=1 Tax=Persicitalea sp. TaxID=3100273 RepID=UPI003593FA20
MLSNNLNYRADNLLSKGAIRFDTAASSPSAERAKRVPGEKLFSENALSGNGERSCATCHQPALFFNDNCTDPLILGQNFQVLDWNVFTF